MKKIFFGFLIICIVFGIAALHYRQKELEAGRKAAEAIQNAKAEEISITLIEGLNNKEIAEYLEEQNIVAAKDFLSAVKSFNVKDYPFLPSKAVGDLQGFLYPDTYRLFASIKDRNKVTPKEASEQVIEKLLLTFEAKLPENAAKLSSDRGLTLYEAIILASVVEKETGRNATTEAQKQSLEQERKTVAGVFYNRLSIDMALESDATVNYVTGKNDPGVSLKDTEVDSPYNTYKYRGLPPTPICNPSLSSIMAVLYPTETDYMYFLHEQTTGKAYFAVTYDQHLANKAKYLK